MSLFTIDVLYKKGSFDKKPRTYRRKARKEHLAVSKKRRKSKKKYYVNINGNNFDKHFVFIYFNTDYSYNYNIMKKTHL